jgi:hypothetical protein
MPMYASRPRTPQAVLSTILGIRPGWFNHSMSALYVSFVTAAFRKYVLRLKVSKFFFEASMKPFERMSWKNVLW